MSDTIQEEFEAEWRKSHASDEGVESKGPARSKIPGKGYAGSAAEFAWMWWQRSSAADQARIAALVEALHGISLVSKNSMSGKEDCGRLARAALSAHREKAAVPSEWVMVPVDLLGLIEQSWRVPNEYPTSAPESVAERICKGLTDLRAILAAASQADGVNQGETK